MFRNRKSFPTFVLCMVLALSIFGGAHAAVTPVSIAIVPPVQFPPDDFTITGVRASALWGRHRHVYGIDLGLVGNITELDFVGVGISGGFNYTKGNTTAIGLQLAGGANVNIQKTNVYGLQAALGVNYNKADSSVNGLQIALANLSSHTTIRGVQAGIYNKARTVYGLQIGLINVADSLYGLQIGLVNFHHRGVFSVAPIINFGF